MGCAKGDGLLRVVRAGAGVDCRRCSMSGAGVSSRRVVHYGPPDPSHTFKVLVVFFVVWYSDL